MAREPHVQAVGFAGLKIEELEAAVLVLRPLQEEALALVHVAVGQTQVASGQAALGFTAALGDKIDEFVNTCNKAKEELNSYSTGL